MISSDDLFLLIKSMSMQEKRHFKLFSRRHVKGKENQYVELFDRIKNQKKHDEEKIKKALASKIPVEHFAAKKNYLLNLVLNSLSIYYANDSGANKLARQLLYVRLLYRRGLYKLCRKVVGRAKQYAYSRESFPEVLRLLDWEWNLTINNRRVDLHKHIYKEKKLVARKIANLADYQHLSGQVFSILMNDLFVRDKKSLARLKKIMSHPLFKNEKKALSFQAKHFYYNISGAYYLAVGEEEKSYEYYKGLIVEMENRQHPHNEAYISSLGDLLTGCLHTGRYEQHKSILEKLKVISDKLPEKSKGLATRAFEFYYMHLLYHYNHQALFPLVIEKISEIEKGIEEHKSIMKQIVIHLYYNFAMAHFGMKNYNESLACLNKILITYKPQDDNLYCTIKILSLLIYLELGKQDLLEYMIRSTYRFFYKRNRLFEFETLLFNYIKNKVPKLKSRREFIESLKPLKKEIKNTMTNPLERKALEFFDFLAWLDSKIENRPFADIIRGKAEAIRYRVKNKN